MLKRSVVIAVVGLFCGAANVVSADNNGTLELGIESSRIAYKEPGFMKQTGAMTGVNVDYRYDGACSVKLQTRFSAGNVDYTSVETGEMDDIRDYAAEARAWLGYDLCNAGDIRIMPYAGAGYRYLNDDSQARVTTTGALGYKRESNYFYSPVGMEVMTAVGSGVECGFVLEYDYFWQGLQKSYLSGAVPSYNDLENKQRDGYGWRASLWLSKKTTDVTIIIEPFLRYWSIRQSEERDITYSGILIGSGVEPRNYSMEYGLKIAVGF